MVIFLVSRVFEKCTCKRTNLTFSLLFFDFRYVRK